MCEKNKSNERDYKKKKAVFFCWLSESSFFYCADVGVIEAAQDNFLGISVSGVGISCPVTVSGTIGVVTSLLLFGFIVESGLLAANLPWALATL